MKKKFPALLGIVMMVMTVGCSGQRGGTDQTTAAVQAENQVPTQIMTETTSASRSEEHTSELQSQR